MSTHHDSAGSLQFGPLARRYADGTLTPPQLVETLLDRIAERGLDPVWITLRPAAALRQDARRLAARWPDPAHRPPLYGLPFAVKDNIDVAGLPTTAACPGFAYEPDRSAPLVDRLLRAGALLVGKTNLDQFATGLSGTRSPYGACESPLVPGLISGGSSSGSAVAVSAGLVAFAIGTDTAGSGRVPAALTGTVGLKPSRGLVSTLGLVPACASLDCASVFALSVADALAVLAVMAGPEPGDPWSRRLPVPAPVPPRTGALRIGVPRRTDFSGDAAAAVAFTEATDLLRELGHRIVPVDAEPFLAAGRLLYGGPWLAERLAAVGAFVDSSPDQVHPVTRRVLRDGIAYSAADVFDGQRRLRELAALAEPVWKEMDVLAVPTVPTTFTIDEMHEDPLGRNRTLGRYSTFANLLDLAAIAVPAGRTAIGRPHGVTLLAPAGRDALVAGLGAAFHERAGGRAGATNHPVEPVWSAVASGNSAGASGNGAPPAGAGRRALLAVVGAHRTGQPLHPQLSELGAEPRGLARTAERYRLFALPGGGDVARPGLVRVGEGVRAASIEVELFAVHPAALGALLTRIPQPLGLGTITLADGRAVHGFLCEAYATDGAEDISGHGSWPAFLAAAAGGGGGAGRPSGYDPFGI